MSMTSAVDAAAVRIAGILWGVTALVVALWLVSGISSVEPGSRAVVMRWGAIDRVVDQGLVLALPAPIETIIRIPGRERTQSTAMHRLAPAPSLPVTLGAVPGAVPGMPVDVAQAAARSTPQPAGAAPGVTMGATDFDVPLSAGPGLGGCLTGDCGLVQIAATVVWTVDEPRAFVAMSADGPGTIAQALERAFTASAIQVTARRALDTVLVVGGPQTDAAAGQARERLRIDLTSALNARLTVLGLGISAQRVDLAVSLPEAAKPAFAAVLSAGQTAERAVAEARSGAERLRQDAAQARTQRLAQATANASEIVSHARVVSDSIVALAQERDPERAYLMRERLYRDRVEAVLHHAGQVVMVSPQTPLMVWWMQLWPTGGKP